MKVGLLQLHNTADIANNKQRLAEGIIDLAHRGAELIVLQELHNSLYFCQVEDVDLFDLAEPIPGPSTDFYGKLAKDLGVVIVTSLFERRALKALSPKTSSPKLLWNSPLGRTVEWYRSLNI